MQCIKFLRKCALKKFGGAVTLTGAQTIVGTGEEPQLETVTDFATRAAFKNALLFGSVVLNYYPLNTPVTPASTSAAATAAQKTVNPNLFYVAGFFNPWSSLASDYYFLKDQVLFSTIFENYLRFFFAKVKSEYLEERFSFFGLKEG